MSHSAPTCIGIILDGNRRWAKERGLPTLLGHRKGFENLSDAVRWIRDAGVSHLVVYAFSTENWNRGKEEVSYLLDIFKELLTVAARDLIAREKVRMRFAGERSRFSEEFQTLMAAVEKESEANSGITVWVCLSYGGRTEIVHAARSLQEKGEVITEESLRGAMWTAEMPDPDIIIRTSGEKRLSGFLPWQSVYSELFFPDVYWPAFSKDHLTTILDEYTVRERRLGK